MIPRKNTGFYIISTVPRTISFGANYIIVTTVILIVPIYWNNVCDHYDVISMVETV